MLRKKSFIIFGVAILLVSIAGFTKIAPAKAETLAGVCGSSYEENAIDNQKLRDCVKHYIDESVKKNGFIATSDDLNASVEKLPVINQVCHPFAHYIGAGAIKELDGDIEKAISHATDYCNWGFFHGMNVELTNLYSGQELFDKLHDGCEYVKRFNFNPYECAHGMGDAFDIASKMDLLEAMKWCQQIEDEGLHVNCSQGAANHWADYYVVDRVKNAPETIKDNEIIKKTMNGDPYYICKQIENRIDRSGCFDYLVRVNNAYKTGMAGWENYCNVFKDPDIADCFQGVGREWAYAKDSTMVSVFNKCLVAKSDMAQQICVIEAINAITQYTRDKEGRQLKEACGEFKNNTNIQTACTRAAKNLQPYFEGKFVL